MNTTEKYFTSFTYSLFLEDISEQLQMKRKMSQQVQATDWNLYDELPERRRIYTVDMTKDDCIGSWSTLEDEFQISSKALKKVNFIEEELYPEESVKFDYHCSFSDSFSCLIEKNPSNIIRKEFYNGMLNKLITLTIN